MVEVGRRGDNTLLFANDTLVFRGLNEDRLTHLCWLLMWF